nr:MAG TPA: Halocidin family [Caudoviricetes sp.]
MARPPRKTPKTLHHGVNCHRHPRPQYFHHHRHSWSGSVLP